jgi:hypothetical protein
MKGWGSPRMAWALWAITCAVLAIVWVMIILHPFITIDTAFLLPRLAGTILVLSTATVGALIASRRPENPIGWIFGLAALVWDIGAFATEYSIYAVLEQPNSLPFGEPATWVAAWILLPTGMTLVFLLLLFPDGRLPSPRWRPVAWIAVTGIVLSTVGLAFMPGRLYSTIFEVQRNPYGLEAFPEVRGLVVLGGVMALGSTFLGATALVLRLRRARGLERQQLKWFAFGGVFLVSVSVVTWLVLVATDLSLSTQLGQLVSAAGVLALAILPVTTGIAILRYRLYDIDVIINRTLVYGTVTVVLAGLFAALSILTQRLVLSVTGQESQAAVVVAALIVTGLFQPLRAWIQTLVDLRFYRRKYDTARTLEHFAGQVRNEVELDQLTRDLVAVVRETMQPTHASLWLRRQPDEIRAIQSPG